MMSSQSVTNQSSGMQIPDLSLPPSLLSQAFPFHFVFNAHLEILQAGEVLQRIIPGLISTNIGHHFCVKRPTVKLDFVAIKKHTRSMFMLESLASGMLMKGQIMYVPEQEVMFFLGSPWVTDIDQVSNLGIKLKDFATHDPIVDFLFLLQTKSKLTDELTEQQQKLKSTLLAKENIAALAEARAEKLEQALEELQKTQMQLVQSEKMSALGNMVAGVAHEINNPVGFLSGNIQPALDYIQDLFRLIDLYQEKFPEPGDEIEEEIQAIELEYVREDLPKLISSMREGIKRIHHISNSLRTFSRADQDYKVTYNIHDGIESTLLILKHRLKANDCRPEINIVRNYGDLPEIACFPGQLNQVFMNILANAIDALEESNQGNRFHEIKKNPNQIYIQTSLENNQVVISFQDNGIGMPEDVKNKIFEHLFTTKSVGKGTGLGMSIAQQIVVEKHQGTLEVQSELGQGTEFTIRIPVK